MNKNIYFFWDKPELMPSAYKLNIEIARAIHPEYAVNLCSLKDAEILISDFDSELMDIFSAVIPPACKSDIFRLVTLYLNGGWYLDCDLRLTRRLEYIELDGMNTVFVRDDSKVPSITNMALFFQKESPLLLKMINLIKSYYRNGIYNNDVWSFSGPGIFNVFYHDDSFSKKSFVEFFKSAKNSTFNSISTSTSTSWKYQQCFGVYKKAFTPVKFRSHSELLKGMGYAIILGKGDVLNELIKVNSGNLKIPCKEEYIEWLSLKSMIMIFKETNSDEILHHIILMSGVDNINFSDLKSNLFPQNLRDLAKASEDENMKKSTFLMFFATILKPEGAIIRADLKRYREAPLVNEYLKGWGV